ncbi:MAG: helix-turn-helix domain-containing protein [Nitriliruptorales bacterium]
MAQMNKSEPNPVEQVGQAVGQAVEDIGAYIRQQREGAQVSLRQLAKLAGVSNPYLSQVERGLRKPSAEILQAIARALKISSETLYVKAGILDEPRGVADLELAILRDDSLSDRQRAALVEIYRSFRAENEPRVAEVPPSDEDDDAAADDLPAAGEG